MLEFAESSVIDELLAERDELLRENVTLRQENQEMSELLKEYEKGLETTTELVRDHSVRNCLGVCLFDVVSDVYPRHTNP